MTNLPTRRWLLQAAAVSALPASMGTWAQTADPAKPALPLYKFVVGFGAGGVPDAAARAMAAQISARWGIPAMVENRLGPAARWRPRRCCTRRPTAPRF